MNMFLKDWNIETITGYKPITTFYTDFSIAEKDGSEGIKNTLKRGMEYADTDYKVLTELIMVLNWKIWEHYKTNKKLAELYQTLWEEKDEYAMNTLKGEALSYYLRTTD